MNLKESGIMAILDGLRQTPVILSDLVTPITEAEAAAVRGEGFWSIAEHVAHLAAVQPMGLDRINRMLKEDHPEFTPFFPDRDETLHSAAVPPMEQLLDHFAQERQTLVERLQTASPTDWGRTAVHPEYKHYSVLIFARHILMHDHWHMYRIEQLWLTHDEYMGGLEG